jgi:hypothetical protein
LIINKSLAASSWLYLHLKRRKFSLYVLAALERMKASFLNTAVETIQQYG